jgi:hypothetical protein
VCERCACVRVCARACVCVWCRNVDSADLHFRTVHNLIVSCSQPALLAVICTNFCTKIRGRLDNSASMPYD